MASILNVDKIRATGSTNDAMTIDSSGNVTFANLEFDMWRNTANQTNISSSGDTIAGNWERADEPSSPAVIGTGMSVDSSGIWTFPSTGIWLITWHCRFYADGTAMPWAGGYISVTTDNSSYNQATEPYIALYATNAFGSTVSEHLMDVTDTSTHKVKLGAKSTSNATVSGLTTENQTYARFWRIQKT